MIISQVSELLCLIASEHPEATELVQLLQCHHFKVCIAPAVTLTVYMYSTVNSLLTYMHTSQDITAALC